MAKLGRKKIEITPQMLKDTVKYASWGLTREQIAEALGMSTATLYERQAENPEFLEAIRKGQGKGIATVANALFDSAVEGNVTAQKHYLNNRAGWKDKVDVDNSGHITHDHQGVSKTLEILRRWRGDGQEVSDEAPLPN